MHKLIFGIFAHPDDEAFGPSATLMKEVDSGAELRLMCVTAGQAGVGHEINPKLGEIRLQEWRAAGKAMGARVMYDLGYADGQLSNSLYHAIAEDIETGVRMACGDHHFTDLSLVTLDPNGITGHLDHIAVSYITTYVYQRLKANPPEHVTHVELAYYCLSESQIPPGAADYFVYFPEGRPKSYINRTVDVRAQLPKKYEVMRLHATQAEDAAKLIACGDGHHAYDHFHVLS